MPRSLLAGDDEGDSSQVVGSDFLSPLEHTAIGDNPPHHTRYHLIESQGDHGITGTPVNGQVLVYRSSDGKWHTEDINALISGGQFFEERLFTTNNSDWVINRTAYSTIDTLNNALKVWRFDDVTEEGVGLTIETPLGSTGFVFSLRGRAQTLPGAPAQVVMRLYAREVPDNAPITAWSAPVGFTPIDIPMNQCFQYDFQTVTFAALGLTAGRITQLQLTRNAANVLDTLFGDWTMIELKIAFI